MTSIPTVSNVVPKETIVDYIADNLQLELGVTNSKLIHQNLVRKVLDNTDLGNLVTEAHIDRANAHALQKANQKKVFVKQKVSKDQERILRDRFWGFQLDFSAAMDSGSHSFHRAHRILSRSKFMHDLGIERNSKPRGSYDAVYKDVGGNPITHLHENFVHTCFPLLSNNDDKRHSNYLHKLRTSRPSHAHREIIKKHTEGDSRVICHRVSQNCKIKAPYLIFLHSTYDMTPLNIAEAMYHADALIGKGCFIFSPKILYENSGSLNHDLNFSKFIRDGEIYIRFWFTNDNQEGYEHLFSTYISLLRTTRIGFSGCSYNVEFEDQKEDDVVFFTIRKSISGSIPRSNVFRTFTDSSLDSKIIVYYWRWETLNEGTFFNSLENHMKPIRLVAPMRLYLKLRGYADTLSDTKFTVQNLLKAAVNFNTREVISGQSVGLVDPVDPDTLKHLVFATYLVTYISNYECFKTLSTLQKDEDRVRSLSSSFFLRRMFSNGFWALRKHIMGLTSMSTRNISFDIKDLDSLDSCRNSLHIRNTLEKLLGNDKLEVRRRFGIAIRDRLVRFITVDEELEALTLDRELHNVSVVPDETINSAVDPVLVRDAIMSNLEQSLPNERSFSRADLVHETCTAFVTIHPNTSNGDCFFQSVIDLGLFPGTTCELRSRLKNSTHLLSMYDSSSIRQSLNVTDGSRNGFMPLETFVLLSLEFDIRVCVHYSGRSLRFGKGKVYHFDVRNDHCSALKYRHEFQDAPSVPFSTDSRSPHNTTEDRDKNFSMFFEGEHNMTKSQFRANLKTARELYYPLSALGNGGYICRSGLKTAEMFERYFDKDIESAISIGGPGAEVQYLVNKLGIRVFGITHTEKIDFAIPDYPAFVQLYGETGDGDIIPSKNKVDFIKKIKLEFPNGVDFFGGDIADNSEYITDYEGAADLVIHEIVLANAILKNGGQAYFKVFDLTSPKSLKFAFVLEKMFGNVTAVKLDTSRAACTEIHLICHDFNQSNSSENFNLLTSNCIEIPSDFEQKMNYITNRFNDIFNGGLNRLKKCFFKIGTRSPQSFQFSDEIVEGFRASLALDNEVRMGTNWTRISSAVSAVHQFFSPRDVEIELADLMVRPIEVVVDDITETSIDDEPSIYEEAVEDVVDPPQPEIVPPSEPEVIIPKRRSFKKLFSKKKKKPVNDTPVEYTTLDQNVPTGIDSDLLRSPIAVDLESRPEAPVVGISLGDCDEEDFTPPRIQSHGYRAAMREFIELTKFTYESERSNHSRVFKRLSHLLPTNHIIRNERGNFGLIETDGERFQYVFRPEIAVENYNKCFDGESFIEFADAIAKPGRYLVSDYCELCLDKEMIDACSQVDIDSFILPDECSIVQAAPGCGKTHFIVNNCVPPSSEDASNILLSTREGRDDFARRLKKRDPSATENQIKTHVRTLASFLLNSSRNKKSRTLFIDEALMAHPGMIFFAIAISGADVIRMLGDILQIPFVNRTPAFRCKYLNLQSFVSISETLYVSYRCPPDVAMRLNSHYLKENSKNGFNFGMSSAVRNLENTCTYVHIQNDNFNKEAHRGKKILVFTQGEKTKLKGYGLDVSTVHEYQGKEADEIVVVRLDPYKTSEIYLRFNYALVALTRHKRKLTYYTRVPTDALATLIRVNGTTVKELYSREEIEQSIHVSMGAWEDVEFDFTQYTTPKSYSSLKTVQTSLKHVSSHNRIFFVPRLGKHYHRSKPYFMSSPVHIVRNFYGKFDIFLTSKFSCKKKTDLNMLKESLSVLVKKKFFDDGTLFFCADSITDDLDSEILSHVLFKHANNYRFAFCINEYLDDIPSQVFELECMNGFSYIDNKVITRCETNEYETPIIFSESTCSFDINHAQIFLNSVFSDICFIDLSFDEYDVFNSDINLELGDITYSRISAQNYESPYENMIPNLHSPCPFDRKYNYREILLALEKRNRNVPYFNGVVDYDRVSSEMLDALLRECFDPYRLRLACSDPVRIGSGDIHSWLKKQPLEVHDQIVPSFAMHNDALNQYSFSIKKQAKPNLTVDAASSYAALQTIVYHEKHINAVFCTMFTELKKRVRYSLRKNVKIFSDISTSDFEKMLDSDIPPESLDPLLDHLEIDISKYDKSQRELALELECKILRQFGIEEELVQLWFNAHILTYIYDKNSKLKAAIPYQRKSGDASTFIGNTLFLMAVISLLIPVSQMYLALFSGDDSLIYGYHLKKYMDTQHFGLMFNLEIKFFQFLLSYFCSRFLLIVDGHWTFTPDPVKLFVKLGRHNLINPAHVEEYRISLIDNCRGFENSLICDHVAMAVCERYGIINNFSTLFYSIPDMLKKENFHTLYTIPNGKINPNTFSNSFDF
ncbi:hypothetical protein 1 [Loreto virus]|uniref:Uncharacterized protein n=3 Tax=Loreto virus TaxID=1170422 RepID=M1F391_9VIRU|nr:hypothetical protein 1 [Loreto virus]AFI24690.1 hypothetical protein 1 [Loreto virus]AQM55311.1 hypothetical protein 1 [Loreto virus]